MKLIDKILQLDKKLTPVRITPFPKRRSRDKYLQLLTTMYRSEAVAHSPCIAWIAVLMNSFYTQERLVCAVTKRGLKDLCISTDFPFKESEWTNFVRLCSETGAFECIKGRKGQPWIFSLKEPEIVEGYKVADLEKMRSDQMEEVKEFIGKAREIPEVKKGSLSKNRY